MDKQLQLYDEIDVFVIRSKHIFKLCICSCCRYVAKIKHRHNRDDLSSLVEHKRL